MERDQGGGLRLAQLVAALSLASDLGLGQPMEHVLRSCLIALRLGERMGLDEDERAVVYYVSLLAWVGCTADSHDLAYWFGDDIAFRADTYDVDLAGLSAFAFMLRHAGAGSPGLGRVARGAALAATAGRRIAASMMAHCQLTGAVAERLGLGPEVRTPLQHNFARWDGKGIPAGLGGEDVAASMRLVHLAEIVEVFHRNHGVEAAVEVARSRRGTQFDPAVVDAFVRSARDLLGDLRADTNWDAVIEAEPALRPVLSEEELDRALEAIAAFADLKSPYTVGHSRGVASLAAEAGRRLALAEAEIPTLRRAGLVHDLGRMGVPNTIWDKKGPLTDAEWERVRLHPYLTERMLARPSELRKLGVLAGAHHERLDGSGYYRGQLAPSLPPAARVLAAADAYHAMTEPRPHREAMSAQSAAAQLREEAKKGRLDGDCVEAVLGAAGHRTRRRPSQPAGLTKREVEVLVRLSRGESNRDIARSLHISRKTVGNHVEHIYAKLGVSTRTAAAFFAMQHGLLDTL